MTQTTYKILVVDDEPDLEHLMRQRMRRDVRDGLYTLYFAHNGVEALELLSEVPDIDMVLSDINMPRMDGLTLLAQIPNIAPDIRAVVVSAYGDMKNIRTAMNRGAFDFITKPIDFQDLRVTIERTLKNMEEWRSALESRDPAGQTAERTERGQQDAAVHPADRVSRLRTLSDLREHGIGQGGWRGLFDVFPLPGERIALAIADVSDKGVPAALFMMSSRTLLKGAAIGAMDPGAVLKEVNDLLTEENEAAMFVTTFYAVYTPMTGQVDYANGGHNPPLVIHPDGSTTLLPRTDGLALGVFPGVEYGQSSVSLSPGDCLVLYTDGVTEAMNADGEEFGMDRLQSVFAETRPATAEEANQAVFKAVHDFAGETPQSDDITCVAVIQR